MSIIVPNVGEVAILQKFLNQVLTLKLYSNNVIPSETDTAASLTEVTGGGYASIDLAYVDWEISSLGVAIHTSENFSFSGPTSAPGTIYGYYIVDPDNVLMWAERFPESALPFTPLLNARITITPRIQVT